MRTYCRLIIFALLLPFVGEGAQFKWSYKNVAPVKAASIHYIGGSFRDPNNPGAPEVVWFSDHFVPPLVVGPGEQTGGPVRPGPNGVLPNNYHVFVVDPGFATEMSLAFLDVSSGSFVFKDLADAAIEGGFVDDNSFEVPTLFTEMEDLFIAVDLTKWLDLGTDLTPGSTIDIDGGVSQLLPGFLISNSPIEFNPATGFSSNDPFTGTAINSGICDGSASVPDIGSSFWLLTIAIMTLSVPYLRMTSGRLRNWFKRQLL